MDQMSRPAATTDSEPGPTPDDVRASWDRLARYWDDSVESGRTWQPTLIQPAVEALLEVQPGERILEIACGTGQLARRLAELGARVLATDVSPEMIALASGHGGEVEYSVTDAADPMALLELGEPASFDAVVCNMALMDMIEIAPLAEAAAQLLQPAGRFVFSTVHPAFNSGDAVRVIEQSEDAGGVRRTYSVKVSGYSRARATLGVAVEGQPVAQWYFHRSLADLLGPFLAAGLVVDALVEPTLDPEDVPDGSTSRVFTEVPPILVARLRLQDRTAGPSRKGSG